MRLIPRFAALIAGAMAVSMIGPQRVWAQDTDEVPAEVTVVLANEAEGVIDPSLADMPALSRPPFNAYRSMRVLSRNPIVLASGRATDVQLPNGRQLRLELQNTRADGRYRVRVSIRREGEADWLPLLQVIASPRHPFFVSGQSFQGGTLVIGVRVGQEGVR